MRRAAAGIAALPALAAAQAAYTCSGITSVSLTAHWPAVPGADLYDLEYVTSTIPVTPSPPGPTPKYACSDNTCVEASLGVDKALCESACTPPTTPAPAPVPPTPAPVPTPQTPVPPVPTPAPLPPTPPPAATYACENGKCIADPTGVSEPICTANCRREHSSDGAAYPDGPKWPHPPYYTSQTSAATSAVVIDLQPDTQYVFRVRSHKPYPGRPDERLSLGWSTFASMDTFVCTTAASPQGQPRGLRRVGGLSNTSVAVAWDPPPTAARATSSVRVTAWDGGAGHRNGWEAAPLLRAPAVAVAVAPAATSAELTGLSPGRVYWVRVGGSDAVPFRTARAGVRYFEAARVASESVTVDFLSQHNSGDLPADAAFMTVYWNMFGGGFAEQVMTAYCVESTDDHWADYLSCDEVPGAHGGCNCKNAVDASYAKEAAGCKAVLGGLSYAKKHPGREPIYTLNPVPGVPNPPVPGEKQLGWWYSTTGNECAEGAAVGTNGCTWARHPVGPTVKGHLLVDNGFIPGPSAAKGLLKHNADVAVSTFATHPHHRCCGC